MSSNRGGNVTGIDQIACGIIEMINCCRLY